jgi:hypothetical protein
MKEINDLLKLSGMKSQLNESVEVEEAYANEPDEEYQTVDTIIRQGTDLNREKQQHPKGGFTGDNPLAEEESDEDEVRELVIFIDNDGQLYQQQGAPIMRNLSRKWDKGIYDHDLAQKLWYYLAVNGAKKYGQDQGTGNGLKMFSPAVRRAAAKEMADNWMEELKAGNKMDEAEEDLEAMLAEILIGEESDEVRTRGGVSRELEKTVADMEQNMDTDDVAGTGFEPVSLSVDSPVEGQPKITANFYKYRNQ